MKHAAPPLSESNLVARSFGHERVRSVTALTPSLSGNPLPVVPIWSWRKASLGGKSVAVLRRTFAAFAFDVRYVVVDDAGEEYSLS